MLASIVFLFLIACTQNQEQKNTNLFSPRVVEAKGFTVPKDSMAEPKVVPTGKPVVIKAGKPEVVLTNTNVLPVGVPEVVMAGKPEIFIPGKDSFLLPKTVSAIDSPYVAGIPEMVLAKDAYIKDNNPQNFSSFTKLQGLKANNIFCIMQDNNGNLWFGTGGGGACRYDGKYFTHFTKNEGMSNQMITSIIQDKSGNLWFGMWNDGVYRYDGKNFTHFTEKEGLSYNTVFSLFQDKDGNIWIGMLNGSISKYNGKSFTHFILKHKESEQNEYPVTSIVQDKSENFWFSTLKHGVYYYNGKTFAHFTTNEGLSNNAVYSMLIDKNENIWFGTGGNGGACFYDGKSFAHFSEKEGLSDNFVNAIIQDKGGNIWFGTDGGGLICYDGKSFTHFTDKEGLANNAMYSLFQDRCGNIWIGGNGSGVSRYNGSIFTHFTEKEGLSDKRVLDMLMDKSGNLWFGTWGGGANRYDGKSFTRFTKKEGLSNELITCMLQDKKGNIWFGTWSSGVICYDGKSFLHYTKKEGLSQNYVMSIIEDKSGNLWFGSDGGGESRYDGKSFTYFGIKEGLSNDGIMCSFKDKNGNLWFGTAQAGVTRYDGKTFTHFTEKEGLSNNWVSSISQDKSGNMWFGTRGGGVCCYDGKSFICFTEKEGLCNNDVNGILQDKRGTLWFGTPFGLSKLSNDYMMKLARISDKDNSDPPVLFKNYTYEDGFLGIGCFSNALFEDTKGTIWIGTNDRLTAYHHEGDEPDTIAPNIQVTGIQLFNENTAWLDLYKKKDTTLVLGNGVSIRKCKFDSLSKWYSLPENLSLAYNNNYVTFNFIGITQKQSNKVKYKYKLEGLDENWSSLTTRTEATYGNISYGTYTFKVKAMNSEGYWSKEFNYSFTIRPPWWKTWWAYTCYILLIIAMIWAVIYSIIENQRKKIRLIVNERNRIARELHDDIGAELNRITIVSQFLHNKTKKDDEMHEKLQYIYEAGKKVLGSIGEIIWTMNPQKDNLDTLLAYIRRFVTEYLETNGIDVSIEFPDDIPANVVSDEYRRNLFLVIKEATSNISKYSKATSVRLSMNIMERLADFEISDNGIGFSVEEKQNWGNGLRNMNQRMKDIGGNFQISSARDQGTLIRLTFPVR